MRAFYAFIGIPCVFLALIRFPADSAAEQVRMRKVKYYRHDYTLPEPEARVAPVLALVYDVPYFGVCGVFPPVHIANFKFRSGGSQGGMSPGVTWEPFELSEHEYAELVQGVAAIDPASLASEARYTGHKFVFDPSFDDVQDYDHWFQTVCERHRDAYHQRMQERNRDES